jgi:hypothetical protein
VTEQVSFEQHLGDVARAVFGKTGARQQRRGKLQ